MVAAAGALAVVVVRGAGENGSFLGEGEEGVALSAVKAAAALFAHEEKHEGEDEAETDGEGEGDDGHGREVGR